MFHLAVESRIGLHIRVGPAVGKDIHRHVLILDLAVLHASAVGAAVLVLHFLFIGLDQLVVLVQVDVTQLARLTFFLTAPALLAAQVFIHLRLEDAEFVHLGFRRHAQFPVADSSVLQSGPEVRVLVDDLSIVINGTVDVTRPVAQQRPVEDGHDVVGFTLDDEVEVFDGSVVVAHLHTQLASVVVSKEVVGIELDGLVIVGHGSAQVVEVVAGQCPVHVVVGHTGFQMNGTAELLVSVLPLLVSQAEHGAKRPHIAVVGVQLKRLVQILRTGHGVFLLEANLALQLVDLGVLAPSHHHRVELEVGLVVVLALDAA